MSPRFLPKPPTTLDFPDMDDAWMNFILSRQSRRLTTSTIQFYESTAYKFLLWAEQQGIQSPRQITPLVVREYLNLLIEQGKEDTTCHGHARAIRTLMRFLYNDGICTRLVTFDMPKLTKKRLPVLNEETLRTVLKACNTRDKAIVLFIADCGIRNSELCSLNWGDINMNNGLVRIDQGKGQKDRAVVVGASARRALLQYRRTIKNRNDKTPLFLSRRGRFTRHGLLIVFRRISQRTGIHVNPHALRRTYVILSLRNNVDPGHIQAMLGHTDLNMVYYYAQLESIDLMRIQGIASPMDGL